MAASVFFVKAIQLYIRNRKVAQDDAEGSLMSVAELQWTMPMLCGCALAGLLAGTVGGLLGLGGGFILGPVFLEMGVPPEVQRPPHLISIFIIGFRLCLII